VEYVREGAVSLPAVSGEADSPRALRPWVLEEDDGSLQMWYWGNNVVPRSARLQSSSGHRIYPRGRICLVKGCDTKLSIYNGWQYEAVHSYTPHDGRKRKKVA
jgi:hypothetical protein